MSRLERKWFEGKFFCMCGELVMRLKDCPAVEKSSCPDQGKGAGEAGTVWMELLHL